MITVDSEELNINYAGFSEQDIRIIKETFVIFQHIQLIYPENVDDDISVRIDGAVFNKPEYIYYVHNVAREHTGIDVQVFKKNGARRAPSMAFVICIYKDSADSRYEYIVYN